MASLGSKKRLQLLEEAGVVEGDDKNGEIQLTGPFLSQVEEFSAVFSGESERDVVDILEDVSESEEERSWLSEIYERCPDLIPLYLAINEYGSVQNLVSGFEESLQIAAVLQALQQSSLPTSGSPAMFLSVHGTDLPVYLLLFQEAIVYVWTDECPPCEEMQAEFDELFESTPGAEEALFSVFGPESAEFLFQEYDVVGAPTTLFVVDGEVDTRLQGSHYSRVIQTEIENLRNRE